MHISLFFGSSIFPVQLKPNLEVSNIHEEWEITNSYRKCIYHCSTLFSKISLLRFFASRDLKTCVLVLFGIIISTIKKLHCSIQQLVIRRQFFSCRTLQKYFLVDSMRYVSICACAALNSTLIINILKASKAIHKIRLLDTCPYFTNCKYRDCIFSLTGT